MATPGVVSWATGPSVDATDLESGGPLPQVPGPLLASESPLPFTPTPDPSATGDVTPPVTTATGADDRWHADRVEIELEAEDDDSGVAARFSQVDGGAVNAGTSIVVPAPRSHANDGAHDVAFFSIDKAGNREAARHVTVKIDTTPPKFEWRDISPTVITRVQPVRLRFHVSDRCGAVKVSYRVTDQYGYHARTVTGLDRATGWRSVDVVPRYRSGKPFAPGAYHVSLTLRDEAGNLRVTGVKKFRNDRALRGKAWRRVSGAGRRVALTFDDGNGAAWASILTTLKRYDAHATFFPLGPYVTGYPDLARRTVREGHAAGSHGWTHTAITRQGPAAVRSELKRTESAWWRATGVSPVPYCRPPYGEYDGGTLSAAGSIGFYRVMLWDVDPWDWSGISAGTITSRVLSHVRPGSIVVLHLTPQTARALPAILRGLKSRRLKAVSLPELFHAAGYR